MSIGEEMTCLTCGFKGHKEKFTRGAGGMRQPYCKLCTSERKARYYKENAAYRDREKFRSALNRSKKVEAARNGWRNGGDQAISAG